MKNDVEKYDIVPVWLLPYYNSLSNRKKKELKKKLKKRLEELDLSF